MELKEALPLLSQNNTAIAITQNSRGIPQSTVVTTGMVDGRLCWISRGRTIKVKNIERTGRATVTVLKLENRRYVTIEGPAVITHWPENPQSATEIANHVDLLKKVYIAMGRTPTQSDEEFAQIMAEEMRIVVSVTPESIYGSLSH